MPSAKDKEKGAFHKASGRHVLVIEADMSENNKRRIFNISVSALQAMSLLH